MSENLKEALRWMKQAERDLISAKFELIRAIGEFEPEFKMFKKSEGFGQERYIERERQAGGRILL